MAGATDHLAQAFRPSLRSVERRGERVSLFTKPLDAAPPGGRGRGEGDIGSAGRKPLYLLELHPVETPVAYDGVEATLRTIIRAQTFPI